MATKRKTTTKRKAAPKKAATKRKKRTTRKAAPKKVATQKKTTSKRKTATPTSRAGKLRAAMRAKGLRLPHGYQVAVVKKRKTKKKASK